MTERMPIELTAIFITDTDKKVTGFFSQFPEAVSQGDSIEEAEKKLFDVLPDVLEIKDLMSEEDLNETPPKSVTRKSYSYQLAV